MLAIYVNTAHNEYVATVYNLADLKAYAKKEGHNPKFYKVENTNGNKELAKEVQDWIESHYDFKPKNEYSYFVACNVNLTDQQVISKAISDYYNDARHLSDIANISDITNIRQAEEQLCRIESMCFNMPAYHSRNYKSIDRKTKAIKRLHSYFKTKTK